MYYCHWFGGHLPPTPTCHTHTHHLSTSLWPTGATTRPSSPRSPLPDCLATLPSLHQDVVCFTALSRPGRPRDHFGWIPVGVTSCRQSVWFSTLCLLEASRYERCSSVHKTTMLWRALCYEAHWRRALENRMAHGEGDGQHQAPGAVRFRIVSFY